MACTTEYRNVMVTKRKALSSSRGCRGGGILTNGLRKKLEDDARATIASIIKKYSGSGLVNGYHKPAAALPPSLLPPFKNGLNGCAKHLIGRISYQEAISEYVGKREDHGKNAAKDKKPKKRVSFGPATVKIFGESDYYDGEKELIKKELAAQRPRSLKKALRDRNKEKNPVIVTGRRSSFRSAQSQIKRMTKRQKHKTKVHVRTVLSKMVSEHSKSNSPSRSPKVKVKSSSLQDCATSSALSKSSKFKETRGRPPMQECKGRPPEIKKCQKSLPSSSSCDSITTNTSKDHKPPVKAVEYSGESLKLPKIPDKSQKTAKRHGSPPKVSKCHTNAGASNILHKKLPKISNSPGRPHKISKSPGKPKMTNSPGRSPKIIKSPGMPPKISKSSGRPPKISKKPDRPPKTSRSHDRPPKITKNPIRPNKVCKSPGKPRKITSPGRSPKIARKAGKPLKITKHLDRPPKVTKSPGRPFKITKSRGKPPVVIRGSGRQPKITETHGRPKLIAKSCNKSVENSKKMQNKTLHNTATNHRRPSKENKSKTKPLKAATSKTAAKKDSAQVAKLYASCAVAYKVKKNSAYLTPYKRKLLLKNYTLLRKMTQSLRKS